MRRCEARVVSVLDRADRLRVYSVDCFTGSARVAAFLQGGRRCLWPGCGRTHRIQIDHTTEWQDLGVTAPWNSGPLCPWHNPFKSTGYHVRRDENGRWHTYRPDGTEIRPI